MTNQDVLNIDEMLSHVGDFSCYQGILMFLFSIINILSAFHYFGQTFLSLVPEYQCNTTELYHRKDQDCFIISTSNISLMEEPCTDWIYNNETLKGYVSIVQELNWVCQNSWKPALGQSMFFVGSVVGGILFGILADTIGRLHTLVIANIFAMCGNAVTVFSKNVTLFSVSRFLAGFATDTNFVMMYIIVPESTQWLISTGQIDRAIRYFQKIAKINGRILLDNAVDGMRNYCKDHIKEEMNENFTGLFRTPNLRRKTLILIYKSMVMTLCYDAISKNVNGVGLSPFVMFSITSSTILPACLFLLVTQDKIGRKLLASGALFLSGVFAMGSGIMRIFVGEPEPWLILTLAIVARLGINTAYNSGHQYALELLPTVVRGQGVSIVHVAGYGATFFGSQILFISNFWKPAPEIILGVIMISGAVACLFLPETLNKTLPITLEDGERFGEDENIWQFSIWRNSKSPSTVTLKIEDSIQCANTRSSKKSTAF